MGHTSLQIAEAIETATIIQIEHRHNANRTQYGK